MILIVLIIQTEIRSLGFRSFLLLDFSLLLSLFRRNSVSVRSSPFALYVMICLGKCGHGLSI